MRLLVEKYRDALYRYSTGQGFNLNVDVPRTAREVAAYKMLPLQARHIGRGSAVDLKRESDRLSMQVESAHRQLLTLGHDPVAGKRYRHLKNRVDALQHLLVSYPIRLIRIPDLNLIYKHFAARSPQLDSVIQRVIEYNKGSALRARKGSLLYDQYGEQSAGGFGEWTTNKTLATVVTAIVAYFLIKDLRSRGVKILGRR